MKAFIIALAAALPLTIAASQASAKNYTYYQDGPAWAQKAFESNLGDD